MRPELDVSTLSSLLLKCLFSINIACLVSSNTFRSVLYVRNEPIKGAENEPKTEISTNAYHSFIIFELGIFFHSVLFNRFVSGMQTSLVKIWTWRGYLLKK